MVNALSLPWQVAINTDGTVIPGAKLYCYQAGTTTLQSVYQDAGLSTAHPNPVVADGYGAFPAIYLDPSQPAYKFILQDSYGATIPSRTIDNYPSSYGTVTLSTAAGTAATGTIIIGATTATTVGAAGGASAPPTTPLGYIVINVSGTQAKIPFYKA